MSNPAYSLFEGIEIICGIIYYRSQKTSSLQKDSGLHVANCGLSLCGLSAGQTLGYSTTPRNVQLIKANLNKAHADYITQQLQRANEVCYVFVLSKWHKVPQRNNTKLNSENEYIMVYM